jgi:integrase
MPLLVNTPEPRLEVPSRNDGCQYCGRTSQRGSRAPGNRSASCGPPSREQIEALIASAQAPEAAAIVMLAASFGLRRGELYALRRDALDVAAGPVHVVAANDRGVITPTETAAGERLVPSSAAPGSFCSSRRRGRAGAVRTILCS